MTPDGVHVAAPLELSGAELERWRELQASNPALASPFFCPEFTLLVGRARGDVRVGVLEQGGSIAGFFPFQRDVLGGGRPAGWGLSDHQGLVAAPDTRVDPHALLRACGLRTWEFDHLDARQATFAAHASRLQASPYLDLSDGFDAYAAGRRRAGVGELRNTERKLRKLARAHGPVTFDAHVAGRAELTLLLAWKAAQYARTGAADLLARRWMRQVIEEAHATSAPGFSGVLSVLRVDGRPVAAHLGLRSSRVWHWWLPAYDPAFAPYSPGLLLLLCAAREAQALGVTTIDLGKGDARYKSSLMSGALTVAEGSVERTSVAAAWSRLRRGTRSLARRSGLGASLRRAARSLRRS
jgi:CelD/BcsL family acetyltransferase involved in cellulose biosynthesis